MKSFALFSNITSFFLFLINIFIYSFIFSILFKYTSSYILLISFIPIFILYLYSKPIYGIFFSLYSLSFHPFNYYFTMKKFIFNKVFDDVFYTLLISIVFINIIMFILVNLIRKYSLELKLLSEKEKKYKTIASVAFNGLALYSKNTILEVNNALTNLLDYTKEELLNMDILSIISPEYRDSFIKSETSLKSEKFETILIKKNRYAFPALINITSVEFNNIPAKAIVIQDLSELKIFERKILYFKKAIEQSPASIVITDLNGDIEYVNPAFTEKTGYSYNEALGKNPRILKNQSKHSEEYKPMWDDLLSGKTWRGEFYNTKKNGEHYWELASISPIIDNNNVMIAFIAVKEDITLRKNMEKELLEAKKNAEELSTAKTRFVVEVSHEIRNPMNGIIGFADVLIDMESDSEKKEMLQMIKRSGNSLLEIVNNILDIYKIDSGKMEVQNSIFSISDTMKNILSLFKVITNGKGIFLNLNISPNTPDFVFGDYLKVQHIITNLISNAVKFTVKGGIVLNITCLEVKNSIASIQFSVEDTGVGIPLDKQISIFDSFTQVDNYLTKKEKGSGIGLSIVKKMVEMLNGHLYIESNPGIGTKFIIEINFNIEEAK
jgi:PAS domain S-box-containing protein